jgi:hypothetical protein
MPRIKLWVYLALFVFAFIAIATLFARRQLPSDAYWAIVSGTIVSIFAISVVELLPEFVRWLGARLYRARFEQFFGTAAFRADVRLVFGHRELREDQPNPWVLGHPFAESDCVAEGAVSWISAPGIRGAVYLANAIFKTTGREVKIIHDKDIETDDFSFCAIAAKSGWISVMRRPFRPC